MTDPHDHRLPADPPTAYGEPYPEGRIVSVIDDEANVDAAISDLEAAGFPPDAIWRASGAEIIDVVQRATEADGTWDRFARLMGTLRSDEILRGGQYVEQARMGRHFLFVRADEDELRSHATQILASHGGHHMRYYGRLMVEDLVSARYQSRRRAP